jgi:hypothetical protein
MSDEAQTPELVSVVLRHGEVAFILDAIQLALSVSNVPMALSEKNNQRQIWSEFASANKVCLTMTKRDFDALNQLYEVKPLEEVKEGKDGEKNLGV